jgi:hypothetical protein
MKLFKFWKKSNKKSYFYIYDHSFFYNKTFKFYSLAKIDLPTNDGLNTTFNSSYAEIVHIKPRFRNPSDPLPAIPISYTVTYLELNFDNHNLYSNLNAIATSKKFENIYEDIPLVLKATNFLSSERAVSRLHSVTIAPLTNAI